MWIQLTLAMAGKPTYLNVERVTHFTTSTGGGTQLVFSDSHSVQVKETPAQVLGILASLDVKGMAS
jgi:hypothetical protein